MDFDSFDPFRKYLEGMLTVPASEWAHLTRYLGLMRIKKDQFFFRQGDSVDDVGFVVQGLLYTYYTTEEGKVHVKKFLAENEPVTCYSDLIRGTAARFSCRAIEDTVLITLKYEQLQKLYQRHICWERMGRLSAEKLFLEKEDWSDKLINLDGYERFRDFQERQEHLKNRVPQYLVASYLDLTPVSISRFKRKKDQAKPGLSKDND